MPALSVGGSPSLSGAENIRRFIEYTLMNQALNDGDAMASPLGGIRRFHDALPATTTQFMAFTAGGAVTSKRVLDGRPGIGWFATAGQNTCWVLSPGGAVHYLDFGAPGFMPTTVPVASVFSPPFGLTCSVAAWCRKLAAGDSSSCRMTLGFANNTVVSPSGPVPRCGLLGDGAGGYRYGSVNCPDGLGAGANADNAIDANAVQPADLVAPGANWWHTRIKLVPATPTQPARWGAYHNGILVATFANQANFPRGHQGTSDAHTRIQASILNFSGDVAALHIPELVLWNVRIVLDDDYTL